MWLYSIYWAYIREDAIGSPVEGHADEVLTSYLSLYYSYNVEK